MTGRAAVALTAATIAASALNYLYQVHAAAVLDVATFGLLSTWLARISVLGAVATVVQYLSLDFALPDGRWRGLLKAAGLVSLVGVGVHVSLGGALSPLLLGVTAVGSGIVLYAVLGQLQARLQLGAVGAAALAAAALRFGLPFAWPAAARAPIFYASQAAAPFMGIVAAAAIVSFAPPRPERARSSGRLRLGRPVLLAFATVLFPLIDVLFVSSTQDVATTGAFSRVSLASRMVFFGGAAVLQILLPHELHGAKTGDPLPRFAVFLQKVLTPGMIGGAIVLAALADQLVLHARGSERTWLYASCLTAAVLVAILGHVNRFAARGRLRVAGAMVLGVVVTSAFAAGLAALGTGEPVARYVLVVLGGDALVLFVAWATQMRSPPGPAVR